MHLILTNMSPIKRANSKANWNQNENLNKLNFNPTKTGGRISTQYTGLCLPIMSRKMTNERRMAVKLRINSEAVFAHNLRKSNSYRLLEFVAVGAGVKVAKGTFGLRAIDSSATKVLERISMLEVISGGNFSISAKKSIYKRIPKRVFKQR